MRIEDIAVAGASGTPRWSAAIASLLTISPLLNMLEGYSAFELDATDFDWLPVTATSSAAPRGVGGSWSAADIVPGAKQTGTLKFHGDRIDIDITHLADADLGLRDIPIWFQKVLKQRLIAFARAYEGKLMNGTGLDNNITGLSVIMNGDDNLPGHSVTRVSNAALYSVDSTPKSLDLSLGATNYAKNIKRFMELLDMSIADMDHGSGICMLMNSAMYARMSTIAADQHIKSADRDTFGVPITTFNDIPMFPLIDGVITNTEEDDTDTPVSETTSLYLLSPGEMRTSLVTNSGLAYWEYPFTQAKESGQEKWEIRAAWKIEEPKSVLRLRNIKLG